MGNVCAQDLLGAQHGRAVGGLLGGVHDGVLEDGSHKELLGLAARKAAVHEVVDLLGAHAADGGAVVAGDVDLVDATDFSPEEEAKLDEADGTDKAKEPEPSDAPAQADQSFGETGGAE